MGGERIRYSKLPGHRRGLINGSSLWLGPDHLLLVNEATNVTTFQYLNNLASLGSATGPTIPAGNFVFGPIPTPDVTDLNQDGFGCARVILMLAV